jgi:beta-galactosidase
MVLFSGGMFLVSAGQDIRFSDSWKFYRGAPTGTPSAKTYANESSWQTVYLPHTDSVILNYYSSYYYVGVSWYRKSFSTAGYTGKKIFLEFEAAMQTDTVYLNGTLISSHVVGYTPHVMDITGYVRFDSLNVLAVKLNNTYSTTFPPGNSAPDFLYFGGLYRNAHLLVMDSLHITNAIYENIVGGGGIFVTTSSSGAVTVKTHVRNEYTSAKSTIVTTTILDSTGAQVATNSTSATNISAGGTNTFTQALTVSSPHVWHPNTPYLYKVKSQVLVGTTVLDSCFTTIGLRTIAFSHATGFSINGARFTFRGADRHQAYPYIGNAVPNSGQYRDAQRMKEYGYNFVRMCHYAQAESFVDACDRLGILGMACLPGWQYSNTGAFVTNSVQALQDMIRLYRNHPSVIVYESIWNETYICNAALNDAAHAEGQFLTCGETPDASCGTCYDVYTSSAQHNLRNFGGGCSNPVIMSEYGDWENGCQWANPITGCQCRIERSAGEASMLNVASIRANELSQNRALTWLSGDAVWTAFDYQSWVNGPYTGSGDMDIFRIPKFSAHFYQSQRDPSVTLLGVNSGPMVFIASYWNTSSSTTVTVYSNCDQVSLYLNSALVATHSPTTGTNLEHPLFSFTIPAFTTGTLRADGLIGGVVKATHSVTTPGTASRVSVVIDTAGLPFAADGSDIAIVYASIVDANGTVVPTAINSVNFTVVSGPGDFVGNNPQAAVAGIASILLRSRTTGGQIIASASTGSLTPGSDTVTSHVPQTTGTIGMFRPAAVYSPAMVSAISQKGSMLFIQLPAAAIKELSSAAFTLYNAQGRLVGRWNLTKSNTSVNIKSLPHGLYFGQISRGMDKYVKKLVW